jgi:hypothetical protein
VRLSCIRIDEQGATTVDCIYGETIIDAGAIRSIAGAGSPA